MATLLLTFEDGSTRNLEMANAIEIDISPERRQSVEFRETRVGGKWIMSFSKPLFEGKKIKSVHFDK